LGGLQKDQVREIARQQGIKPVSDQESQDICFVQNDHYSVFLENRCRRVFYPGPIVDAQGNRIGTHKGLHRYTIGQRRGIDCPAASAYYVIEIDPSSNRLVVGFENSLYKSRCTINQVNWMMAKPDGPVAVRVRLRYRHAGAEAEIEPTGDNRAVIRFARPQKAITPGQAAVCYQHDRVVAAGWIESK
jgi:tRNA-specific 2-thiouridylase